FAMSYGVFQEYYFDNWTLQGGREVTGIIGTTTNGVMYLSMPLLFALFTRRWAHRRRMAALCGAALTCISFVLSSFSTHVWHLVATQGVMAALGCALIYSPTTLSLGEWFKTSNRAVTYGVSLSCKNIVGSACPFLVRVLLNRYGFRTTLQVWAAIATGTSIPAIFLIPTHPSSILLSTSTHRARKNPWEFLKHQSFYIYSTAIILQSCGYGIPQTYLNQYAHDVTLLSQTSATLLLTVFNIPGIASSSFFGYLSDNKHFPLSATTVTAISAVSSALSAFLIWGLTSQGSMALLVLFSITFGFFAGGYSATWGGVINELEREASQRNEAIDTGMVYGLLNGARGVGYVSGGLAGVPLLKSGSRAAIGGFGYATTYGPLIIFTGLSSVFGGWGIVWKWMGLLHLV
ncbi:major facilitator superfamily domain-containing protein, partial [Pseudomassariella vexata]